MSSLMVRPSSRITPCTCPAISEGREKVIVFVFLLMSFLFICCLTIYHWSTSLPLSRTPCPASQGILVVAISPASPFVVSWSSHEQTALRQACLELAERLRASGTANNKRSWITASGSAFCDLDYRSSLTGSREVAPATVLTTRKGRAAPLSPFHLNDKPGWGWIV